MSDISLNELHATAEHDAREANFITQFPERVLREAREVAGRNRQIIAQAPARDLTTLLWSSIDNSESLDLDQVEFAERLPDDRIRLLIGIADVDAFVPKESAIDRHARANTVSIYTPGKVFPLLPEQLSNDTTSLREGETRLAVVTEMSISTGGAVGEVNIYRALIRNRVKLVYERIGEWLDGDAPLPAEVARIEGLEAQLRLQEEAAERLRGLRLRKGALELETGEAVPVIVGGHSVELLTRERTRAQAIIENFMIAANTAMAEFLESEGLASLRRVVREPERWPRIVEIAAQFEESLPARANSLALSIFLSRRRAAAPARYAELSLSILKLMGAGEYLVETPDAEQDGHFGLALEDYTHSTAPNRRYADLVTQRSVKSLLAGEPAPYTVDELRAVAARCNLMESAARGVERRMRKAATALVVGERLGEEFEGVVTGVKEKGTFVKLIAPPVEGKIV
ncbi:MAG TPA: RNB domain-containing ribonuclease, partial [Pyrinomonadaceae bacterium]